MCQQLCRGLWLQRPIESGQPPSRGPPFAEGSTSVSGYIVAEVSASVEVSEDIDYPTWGLKEDLAEDGVSF